VTFEYDSNADVLAIGSQLLPPFIELSHLTIEPVCPDKVSVPLSLLQELGTPEMLPPLTEFIVKGFEL
jgi:hypothetical protein